MGTCNCTMGPGILGCAACGIQPERPIRPRPIQMVPQLTEEDVRRIIREELDREPLDKSSREYSEYRGYE